MAEKKTTTGKVKPAPKKRTAMKVEESTPANEVQQAVEHMRSREINWDVIGLSSVAVPLVGAGFLFIVGWAYESNWYEYFGIDVSQLNISLQQYLVHSVTGLALSLSLLLTGTFLYLFVKMAILIVQSLISKQGRDFSISRSDWLGITIFYIWRVVSYLFPDGINSLSKQPIEIRTLIILSQTAAAVLLISLTGIFMAYSVRRTLYRRYSQTQTIPNPSTKPNLSTQVERSWQLLNSLSILLVYFFVFLFSTMALAASIAVTHASFGSKLSLLSVQKVYLDVPRALTSLQAIQDINELCDQEGRCLYGPFGLVAESPNSFYMIVWREDEIPFRPGLFMFPRTEQNGPYLVIPALAISDHPTPTPTATLDIMSTPILTILPTLKPELTSTPSQP
jgi:hypothetical protein